MSVPIALTIAGSDSGAGAGIQADLKTFAALGVYGASVLTALTAQNTTGVSAIHHVPTEFVAAQMDAVFADLDIAAVKIGMLGSAAAIATVEAGLRRHRAPNVVLDTVMAASSGAKLLADDAIGGLRGLMAQARLVTTSSPCLRGQWRRPSREWRAIGISCMSPGGKPLSFCSFAGQLSGRMLSARGRGLMWRSA